jgi:hypothetical protein
MQDIPLPISLPFEDSEEGASCQVYVLPHKTYGGMQGSRLLELYGVGTQRFRTETPKPHGYLHWTEEDNLLIFGNIVKGDSEVILKLSPPTDDVYIVTIHFAVGLLPESMHVGKHYYNFKDIIHIMEDILKEKFICRYDNRCMKQKVNTSIEVCLQPSEKGVIIFSKKNICYLLRK